MSAGYRAHIIENGDYFVTNRSLLLVARERMDGVLEVETMETFGGPDEAVAFTPLGLGISLPTDALPAIRDAIDQKLGRRYDEALVNELRAALDHERQRVDRILSARSES